SAQDLIETAPIVVMDPQSFEVELEIQADGAGDIRPGQRVYVVLEEEVSAAQAAGATRQTLLDIAQQRGSEGTVFAVSPSQTPGSRGTEVSIRDLQTVRNLKVGGRVYVWIEVAAESDAVVLPLGALLPRDQQVYAFVVNEADGTVQRRRVTPGIEGLSGVEILSGVEPGELVVIEGQNRLVDGAPVEVVNQETVP
ncbi:MAG: multidrug transporter, partial [Cyanobacteria bacterium J06659_2]